MNNTKNGMRAFLASAAAGALILGSAAGAATAKPSTPKGPKPAKPAVTDVVRFQSVSIKGHRPIDLAKVDATTALKLRATVQHRVKVASDQAASISVTLGVYTKRVNGSVVPGTVPSDAVALAPVVRAKPKRVQNFKGNAVLATIWEGTEVDALKALLKPGDKAYICIATATPSFVVDKYSMQVRKRLAKDVKRPVRDCVKVIDSTP